MQTRVVITFLVCTMFAAGCVPVSIPPAPAQPSPEPTATPEPTVEPTATAEPAPVPPTELPVPAIELQPFTSETFGIRGVVPAGWDEIAPGAYNRGSEPGDLARLIQQAAPGATAAQLITALLGQLGIDALPDRAGTSQSAAFTWDLYEMEVEVPGVGTVMVALALAETETGAYIVLLQALPDDYEGLYAAVFMPALQALAPTTEEEAEAIDEDPEGLFTVPVPTNWTVEQLEGYARLSSPDDEMTVYVLALKAEDFETGLQDAWAMVDPDFDLEPEEVIDEPVTNGADRAVTVTYDTGDDESIVLAGGWMHDGIAYVEIFRAELEALQKRYFQLQIINTGFKITALEQKDLTGVEPLPLTQDLIAELEAYIDEKMEELEVPGAAVAIVRDGELAYARGFGVRDLDTRQPVTPETLMMIGSTTKSMTTMLMAQLVDEGVFTWDTPVVDVLPAFKVADPEVTQRITMRHLVCACTGVPRRDLEWLFNASEITAEDVIESLADFEFFTDFGEAFQYSNQMVASAGYISALAAGGEYGNLYQDYLALMQEHILDPIGMTSSTFSFDETVASGNYATPYGTTPLGDTVELSLGDEELLVPMTPAGTLWSNALDMARYLITDLNRGVAPDGTRVVSAENLAVTWEPQVDITADASYGLGWIVEDYHGLLVLSHAGNTFGFSSELALLPETGLGVTILTNQRASMFNPVVRARLLELLFDQDAEIDEQLQFSLERIEKSRTELRQSLQDAIDAAEVEPYLGRYTNDALGETVLEWVGDALVLDAGEFQVEIRARLDDGEVKYTTFTTPLEGVPVEFSEDDDGNPIIVFGVGVVEYTFENVK